MGAGMAAGVSAGTVIGTFALKCDAEVRVSPTKKSRKIAKRTRRVPAVLFMLTPGARTEFLTPPVTGKCVSATLSETIARGKAPTEIRSFHHAHHGPWDCWSFPSQLPLPTSR